ncbi:tyrosine-type recombinase/integrase [Terrihalobacillus insolitus]|uniref:tyrosine-type recombinase/integrase n=1 Tax=Terrihalobacillus insolitus TaxID=2950438 RepID=UPI00234281E2|nr:tyrosine-type recombinase/integrase [Terrihalobacillus insolitus]MDC3415139.1 tyrosine-type recombinase/integrase [Terrihalobacillus insolitus]
MLNLTNLKEGHQKLINYMKEGDYPYSSSYIQSVEAEIKRILNTDVKFDSYEDYYLYRVSKSKTNSTKRYRFPFKSHITVIMNFDIHNEYPCGQICKHQLFEDSQQSLLCENFKEVIDVYQTLINRYEKNEKTCQDEIRVAEHFFTKMQELEIFDISSIGEKHVISYFMNENKEMIRGYSCRWRLKRVLETAAAEVAECSRIAFLLPALKKNRKNIQYLSDDELNKIKKIILDMNVNISFRTRAIGTLLVYTGLRSVDIANLKLEDIDWENDTIKIIQSKTSNPLELPMEAMIGNALYSYIINERPKSEQPFVFLKNKRDYSAMGKSAVSVAVGKIMDAANIRMNHNDRRGTHIFRHRLASSMLERSIPAPVISAILGHSSSHSLDTYVHTDFVHLKECALNVEMFPIYMDKEDDCS